MIYSEPFNFDPIAVKDIKSLIRFRGLPKHLKKRVLQGDEIKHLNNLIMFNQCIFILKTIMKYIDDSNMQEEDKLLFILTESNRRELHKSEEFRTLLISRYNYWITKIYG